MSTNWTAADIPDQTGRTAVVTGANSGLGLETARELARHGAAVVLACRDTAKGERALQDIQSSAPAAQLELAALDLGSLEAVKAFAERLAERGTRDRPAHQQRRRDGSPRAVRPATASSCRSAPTCSATSPSPGG